MVVPNPVIVPTPNGSLKVEEAEGACVVEGCGVKGGGLVRIQEATYPADKLSDLLWQGKVVVICGKHLIEVLGTQVKVFDA